MFFPLSLLKVHCSKGLWTGGSKKPPSKVLSKEETRKLLRRYVNHSGRHLKGKQPWDELLYISLTETPCHFQIKSKYTGVRGWTRVLRLFKPAFWGLDIQGNPSIRLQMLQCDAIFYALNSPCLQTETQACIYSKIAKEFFSLRVSFESKSSGKATWPDAIRHHDVSAGIRVSCSCQTKIRLANCAAMSNLINTALYMIVRLWVRFQNLISLW